MERRVATGCRARRGEHDVSPVEIVRLGGRVLNETFAPDASRPAQRVIETIGAGRDYKASVRSRLSDCTTGKPRSDVRSATSRSTVGGRRPPPRACDFAVYFAPTIAPIAVHIVMASTSAIITTNSRFLMQYLATSLVRRAGRWRSRSTGALTCSPGMARRDPAVPPVGDRDAPTPIGPQTQRRSVTANEPTPAHVRVLRHL